MTSSFVISFRILQNFGIPYFWTDLADIWLREQTLGLIPNLRRYLTLEANIKPILAISCIFASEKETDTL